MKGRSSGRGSRKPARWCSSRASRRQARHALRRPATEGRARRALVNRPKVLLDEPLGALDLKLRKEMQLELKSLQHEVGITFVYVTHDQEEALTMSDRIAVINEGKVQQVADPATLYELPKTASWPASSARPTSSPGRSSRRARRGDAAHPRGLEYRSGGARRGDRGGWLGGPRGGQAEKVRFGGEGDNVVHARIKQVVYLGQHPVHRGAEGRGTLVLYQQNVHKGTGPREGDEVSATWEARNCRVLGE